MSFGGDPEPVHPPHPPAYSDAMTYSTQYEGQQVVPVGQPTMPNVIYQTMQTEPQIEQDTMTGNPKRDRKRPCKGRRGVCDLRMYTTLALAVLACICTGLGLGFDRVKPFMDVQHFVNGTCEVTFSEVNYFQREGCSCGKHCQSSFACLTIFVDIYDEVTEKTYKTLIHSTEYSLSKGVM